jgi:hypothetical protein
MVPFTPLDVFGKTRAPESLTFPAVAHPSAAHAGYLHGATERRLASLEAKFAQLCDAKEAALGLHSKMLQLQSLNEQCAIGFLNFNPKPMRIYSPPSHFGRSDVFTAAQAHFYFAEVPTDPHDTEATSAFYMLGHVGARADIVGVRPAERKVRLE